MESMIDAGVHMGFPREVATKLVLATLRGSASYALQSADSVHALKSNVS
jgi:pyrroline-5-carboxylate reductase